MKEYILTTAVILFFLIPRTFGQIDYSNLAHWAAHPDKTDMADISPNEDITDEQERAIADVFFIHPTTFIQKANRNIWNADINDELVNAQTDQKSIKNQASVFNGSARVFAPRYRQVHLKGFIREKSRKTKVALDLAYQDVAKAFEYYLEHWHKNRPLIIASHSQGTRHAERLIRDYIDGQDLSDQFVTAYLVGGYVPKNAFSEISVCASATETKCFSAWRTYDESYVSRRRDKIDDKYAVVNPLNWTQDQAAASSENMGAYIGIGSLSFINNAVGARISKNQVIVDAARYKSIAKKGNLHNYDYNLFYLNIRKNVAERIESFVKKI